MGLLNKQEDFTPFDMKEKPVKQNPFLMPLLWGASWLMTARFGMTIEKTGMQGIKPPFLVMATHQGFSDYFIAPRVLFPYRANYISDMEGFANYGKWLYKQGGCIGKRRYVPEVAVMLHIRYVLNTLRQPLVLFPESRHCDAGITSTLPCNLGKLAKWADVPLVILSAHGSYLASPLWDEAHTRKTKMAAKLECLFTTEQLRSLSADEVQAAIEEKLTYDEYAWQREQGFAIDEPNRAEGLHLPLYQCMYCSAEGQMHSKGTKLFCKSCQTEWELLPEGFLLRSDGSHVHIPDWYRWERLQTEEAIRSGQYEIEVRVRVEALPNEHGFIPLGEGTLRHERDGFTLTLDTPHKGLKDNFPLHIPSRQLESAQTEYNYRERGKCLVLSTQNCCYYVWSDDPHFLVTKTEFAAEYFFADSSGFIRSLCKTNRNPEKNCEKR